MSKLLQFVNPYHFITTKDSVCEREEVSKDRDTLTGYIDFEIETKTPLFIPNTSRQEIEIVEDKNKNKKIEHINLEFFSYIEKDSKKNYEEIEPVIPGSSIRGMIRNIYETLTNSCLSVIDDDSILYKRTNDHYSPGLLKINNDGSVDLYKADVFTIKFEYLDIEVNEGEKVKFNLINPKDRRDRRCKNVVSATQKDEKRTNEGYIVKGENGFNKKNAHIFCSIKINNRDILVKKNISLKGLEYAIESYSSEKINKDYKKDGKGKHKGYKKYKDELDKFLNNNGEKYFPVYYSEIIFENNKNKKLYYLSPACITKEVYNNSVKDLLNKNGNYNPCQNKKYLCPACRLFGMVGESEDKNKQADSVSSFIRIEDGILLNDKNTKLEDIYYGKVTLQELSSPKISSTEFYLQKPVDADFWTYDYYVKNGKIYEDFPKISGRKFYWHHPKVNFPECDKTERNRTVTPIKEGVKFKSKLYFENISEKQLKQLIWICNISSDGNLGYKLGMGKPIGLGSVKLKVNNVKIRSFMKNNKLGYYLDDYESDYNYDYDELGFSKEVEDAFKIMCDFNSLGTTPICYPISEGQSPEKVEKGYEWFSYNRYKKGAGNGKMTKRSEMELDQYLEPLNNEVQILVQNKRSRERINNNCSKEDFQNKQNKNKENESMTLEKGDVVEGKIKNIIGKKIEVEINKQNYEVNLSKHKKFKPKNGGKVEIKVKSLKNGLSKNVLEIEDIKLI